MRHVQLTINKSNFKRRYVVRRIHGQAPEGQPWFWTITARTPQSTVDRGYAESREQAMADFKARWLR
jgi:hypothetical protein